MLTLAGLLKRVCGWETRERQGSVSPEPAGESGHLIHVWHKEGRTAGRGDQPTGKPKDGEKDAVCSPNTSGRSAATCHPVACVPSSPHPGAVTAWWGDSTKTLKRTGAGYRHPPLAGAASRRPGGPRIGERHTCVDGYDSPSALVRLLAGSGRVLSAANTLLWRLGPLDRVW